MMSQRPFPGLRPFDYRDRSFFFGRQEQIYSLYRLVDRSRFVSVVGSSGSGKSSLVRAGLLPLLDEETREEGARNWKCVATRPGESPIVRLANALACITVDEDPALASARRERIEFDLRRSSFGMSEALGKVIGLQGTSLLLVVDQFEELFRYADEEFFHAEDSVGNALSRDEAAHFVQLLIECSRATVCDVHVVITMRSDFIGDCARFHGLPEVVAGAQFLVPALTRDQLEEVIRGPLKLVGDTVEPTLVERLLNDCTDDQDQLPVLQHCLLRLWERAGGDPPPVTENATSQDAAQKSNVRHLSLAHYTAIGGVGGALSQHADEILFDLLEVGLAVEQTFRALSETDREGRAIRRALPFSQLLAETGVSQKDLHRVIDRFRSDDCSFLTPSPRDASAICPETRVDVGHEALLRRWERISGRANPKAANSAPQRGWLADEEHDGRIYRGLLSLLDHEGRKAPVLPLSLVEERCRWWSIRPRTAAWAARYGGGFERVTKLLAASRQALKADERRALREKVFAGSFVVVVFGFLGVWYRQTQENEKAYLKAFSWSSALAKQMADEKASGHLTADGALKLLVLLNGTSEALLSNAQSLDARASSVKLKIAVADAMYNIGAFDKMLRVAQDANAATAQLVQSKPRIIEWQALLYGSLFRLADAQASLKDYDNALLNYRAARLVADELTRQNFDLQAPIFIENKIGETMQAKRNFDSATMHFANAIQMAQHLVDQTSASPDSLRLLANAFSKAAALQIVQENPNTSAAIANLDKAILILEDLARKNPDETTLSNLATAQGSKAKALASDDLKSAEALYLAAISTREPLVKRNEGYIGTAYLARDYERLADILKRESQPEKAVVAYRQALALRKAIADKAPNDPERQKKLVDVQIAIDALERLLNRKAAEAIASKTTKESVEPGSRARLRN